MREVFPGLLTPPGWPGKGPVVSLLIPECELHCVTPNGQQLPTALINRPQVNKVVAYWLTTACQIAKDNNAALILGCDSSTELNTWLAQAQAKLNEASLCFLLWKLTL